jgi:hypothetical protein
VWRTIPYVHLRTSDLFAVDTLNAQLTGEQSEDE